MDLTTPGVQVYTTATADRDGNGIADIREILRSYSSLGSNNFTTALQTIDTLFTALPGDPNLIFMSDGYGQLDPLVAKQVADDIRVRGGNVNAFAIGEASTIETLEKIDDKALKVNSFSKPIEIFSGFDNAYALEPLKDNVTVYLDVNNNGRFDATDPNSDTLPHTNITGKSNAKIRPSNSKLPVWVPITGKRCSEVLIRLLTALWANSTHPKFLL